MKEKDTLLTELKENYAKIISVVAAYSALLSITYNYSYSTVIGINIIQLLSYSDIVKSLIYIAVPMLVPFTVGILALAKISNLQTKKKPAGPYRGIKVGIFDVVKASPYISAIVFILSPTLTILSYFVNYTVFALSLTSNVLMMVFIYVTINIIAPKHIKSASYIMAFLIFPIILAFFWGLADVRSIMEKNHPDFSVFIKNRPVEAVLIRNFDNYILYRLLDNQEVCIATIQGHKVMCKLPTNKVVPPKDKKNNYLSK